jgi:hypothetical protein
MIAMAIARRPEGDLFFEGADDAWVIENVRGIVDGGKAGTMGEDMSEGDGFLAAKGESGPDGEDGRIERNAGIPEGLEDAGGGGAFGAGVDESQRAGVPRLGRRTVAEAAGEADDLAALEPDGYGSAEFSAGGEVFLEEGG